MISQIGLDINQTYAGRYVFSGYRTDEPPVFIEDFPDLEYVITQDFDKKDIESIMSFQKDLNQAGYNSSTDDPVVRDAKVIKLAYDNAEMAFSMTDEDGNPVTPGIVGANGAPAFEYTVETKSIRDADAYAPPAAASEDGTVAETFRDGTEVTYNKAGFLKGELNPLVYFDCIEVTGRRPVTDVSITLPDPPVDESTGAFNFVANAVINGGASQAHDLTGSGTEGPKIRINGTSFFMTIQLVYGK